MGLHDEPFQTSPLAFFPGTSRPDEEDEQVLRTLWPGDCLQDFDSERSFPRAALGDPSKACKAEGESLELLRLRREVQRLRAELRSTQAPSYARSRDEANSAVSPRKSGPTLPNKEWRVQERFYRWVRDFFTERAGPDGRVKQSEIRRALWQDDVELASYFDAFSQQGGTASEDLVVWEQWVESYIQQLRSGVSNSGAGRTAPPETPMRTGASRASPSPTSLLQDSLFVSMSSAIEDSMRSEASRLECGANVPERHNPAASPLEFLPTCGMLTITEPLTVSGRVMVPESILSIECKDELATARSSNAATTFKDNGFPEVSPGSSFGGSTTPSPGAGRTTTTTTPSYESKWCGISPAERGAERLEQFEEKGISSQPQAGKLMISHTRGKLQDTSGTSCVRPTGLAMATEPHEASAQALAASAAAQAYERSRSPFCIFGGISEQAAVPAASSLGPSAFATVLSLPCPGNPLARVVLKCGAARYRENSASSGGVPRSMGGSTGSGEPEMRACRSLLDSLRPGAMTPPATPPIPTRLLATAQRKLPVGPASPALPAPPAPPPAPALPVATPVICTCTQNVPTLHASHPGITLPVPMPVSPGTGRGPVPPLSVLFVDA